MLGNIKEMFNRKEKTPREEYEEKEQEAKEADREPIKTSTEFKKGGDINFSLEGLPEDAEERYNKAMAELKELKDKGHEDAIELDNKYNSLIEQRNAIIDQIKNAEGNELEELRGKLGRKNKEIRQFENEELNV